jgi:ABC-type transport system involved in multi-copper enzyme maturation permease subunit
MLGTIIKREIQEYLRSSKFLIGFLITVILITISTIININDYKQRNQDYLSAQKEMTGDRFYVQVIRQPEVLSTLVQGRDRKLGNRLQMTYLDLPYRTSGYMGESASQHHRFMAGFAAIDFAFVVRVVLSLMVIFLAYNAIAEEKFQGTLKLMLANQLPRDQLLLGKFFGGLVVIIALLLIATILLIVIMLIHPAISLGKAEWVRILLMFGISIVYLICFYTLTIFISTLVNRPAIAMLILLQIWVFLIIIYPNLSVIVAENFYKLPTEQEIGQQKETAFQPYNEENKKNWEAFNSAIMSGGRPSNEVSKRHFELSAKRAELDHQVDMEFSNDLTRQMKLAQYIAILSPAVLYDQAIQRLARTDMTSFERFIQGAERHWQKLLEKQKLRYDDVKAWRETKLPEFSYPVETNAKSLISTFPQVIILFLFSLIFFVLAYVSFLRKDVR